MFWNKFYHSILLTIFALLLKINFEWTGSINKRNSMPVKIRLTRRGRKKFSLYDVVIADSRAPRDGRFIEKIGTYNPNTNPAAINLNDDKAFDWIMKGAQPTDTVRAILSYRGLMYKKHLQIGVNKGAITQDDADKKFENWLSDKEAKIQAKVDKLASEKATKAKERLAAEKKVSDARAEAIAQRKKDAEAALAAEVADAGADDGEKALEEEGKEAVAEAEAPKAEAPAPAAEEAPEAPAEEVKVEEEAPKTETAPKEEAPKAEEAPTGPVEEAPKEAEKPEPKAEAPAKEEKPAEEAAPEAETKKEEPKKEEAPKAKAAEEPKEEAQAKEEEKGDKEEK